MTRAVGSVASPFPGGPDGTSGTTEGADAGRKGGHTPPSGGDPVDSPSASPERIEDWPDEQLMMAFAHGQLPGTQAAFDVLYQRHRGPLFRFVLRSVYRPEIAEELYQDIWIRLIDARSRYQVTARFQTYLYRIAQNRIIDHFRALRPVQSLSEDASEERIADPDQEEAGFRLDRQAAQEQLKQAIADLPLDQRTAFLLQSERGMSLEQIAEISGVGRETIKSRLRYAVAKLRDALGVHHATTD